MPPKDVRAARGVGNLAESTADRQDLSNSPGSRLDNRPWPAPDRLDRESPRRPAVRPRFHEPGTHSRCHFVRKSALRLDPSVRFTDSL